jgi:hypothetical protein
MHYSQAEKSVVLFSASTTAAATASGQIDRLGFNSVSLDLVATSANAASNKPTAIVLSESDTSNGTTTAISTGGTDFTIPSAATSGNQITTRWDVDCRKRKRWLTLTVTAATTQVLTGVARLGRAEGAGATTTAIGVASQHIL